MSAPSPTQTQAAPVASFTREGTIILPEESGDQQECDAVFSTGSDVVRFDFSTGEKFLERLRIDASSVRLERFQSGNTNVLDGHNSFGGVAAILGNVLSASVRNGQLVGTLKILHSDTWRLLKGGAARALSVGYQVFKYEIHEATAESLQVREAVDWMPVELSVVPISADAGSAVTATRSIEPVGGNQTMDQNVVTLEEATAAASGAKMANPEAIARSWVAAGLSAAQSQNLALDHVAREIGDDGARPNTVVMGADLEVRGRHVAMIDAITHRGNPEKFPLENHQARQYASMTLFELAKVCLGRAGAGITDKNRIINDALSGRSGGMLTSSDFPGLLGDSFNKMLRREYEDLAPTFERIVRRSSATDFKNLNRLQIGDAPDLKKVEEHGEVTVGALGEGKEVFKISEFARIVSVTRQALINDDTDAFQRLPRLLGIAARHLEADLVWSQITDNANLADNVKLFHATHNNLASSGGVISVTTLGAGHSAMRKQVGIDGRLIDLRPATLVVPVALEILALKQVADISADQSANVNPFASMLEVVAEPRLDADSETKWYLAADIAQSDIIELATLNGEGPMVETKVGFEVSGIQFKVSHDCGAKILDFRSVYRNDGS